MQSQFGANAGFAPLISRPERLTTTKSSQGFRSHKTAVQIYSDHSDLFNLVSQRKK